MIDILKEISENKLREVQALFSSCESRRNMNLSAMCCRKPTRSLKKAILKNNTEGLPGIIAEFKRRSPSKGDIAPMKDVKTIVTQYQQAGASGCSVLTDTRFFGGSIADFAVAKKCLSLPILRKDFILKEVQVSESRLMGADVILLIASLLTRPQIRVFTRTAHSFGMEVLLEIHSEKEIKKIIPEVDMVGVNNRALSSFTTDISHSGELYDKLPRECVKIAESGIKTPEDIKRLKEIGYHGFLIGETFMKSDCPEEEVRKFLNI